VPPCCKLRAQLDLVDGGLARYRGAPCSRGLPTTQDASNTTGNQVRASPGAATDEDLSGLEAGWAYLPEVRIRRVSSRSVSDSIVNKNDLTKSGGAVHIVDRKLFT
jgi:hypothetical protein